MNLAALVKWLEGTGDKADADAGHKIRTYSRAAADLLFMPGREANQDMLAVLGKKIIEAVLPALHSWGPERTTQALSDVYNDLLDCPRWQLANLVLEMFDDYEAFMQQTQGGTAVDFAAFQEHPDAEEYLRAKLVIDAVSAALAFELLGESIHGPENDTGVEQYARALYEQYHALMARVLGRSYRHDEEAYLKQLIPDLDESIEEARRVLGYSPAA